MYLNPRRESEAYPNINIMRMDAQNSLENPSNPRLSMKSCPRGRSSLSFSSLRTSDWKEYLFDLITCVLTDEELV
jgi:hypothetical protein